MEEEMLSVISSGEAIAATSEASDSNISTFRPANKRQRLGNTPNGSSSRFKGVMRQKNGQWGAQLYANHTRIWLGTFKSEADAAMAYDSAVIKFRTGDPHRNFPWTHITVEEPKFQSHYSAEAVLSMIRDGSYQYRFMDFVKAGSRGDRNNGGIGLNSVGAYSNRGLTFKQLFRKELTPSDVGKLNRLVIPKRYAVKYFPPVLGGEGAAATANDAELVFYDRFMKLWKFRYCYWSSSQSFVFTRGWNRFLKEKKLKANDVVGFYVCERRKDENVERFCMIDVKKFGSDDDGSTVDAANLQVERELDLKLGLGIFDVKEGQEFLADEARQGVKAKGFKLFGFHIN